MPTILAELRVTHTVRDAFTHMSNVTETRSRRRLVTERLKAFYIRSGTQRHF